MEAVGSINPSFMEGNEDSVVTTHISDTPLIGVVTESIETVVSETPEMVVMAEDIETVVIDVGTTIVTNPEEEVAMLVDVISTDLVPAVVDIVSTPGNLAKKLPKNLGVKTLADLKRHVRTFQPEFPIKYGHVARHLFSGLSNEETVEKLIKYLYTLKFAKNIDARLLLAYVRRFHKKLKIFMQNVNIKWDEICCLLQEPFKIPTFQLKTVALGTSSIVQSSLALSASLLKPILPDISTSTQLKAALPAMLPVAQFDPSGLTSLNSDQSKHSLSNSSSAHQSMSASLSAQSVASSSAPSQQGAASLSQQSVMETSSSAQSNQAVSTTSSSARSHQAVSATSSSAQSNQAVSTISSSAQSNQAVSATSSSAQSNQAVSTTSSSAQSHQAVSATSSSAQSNQAVSVTSSATPSWQSVMITSSSAPSKQAVSTTSSSSQSKQAELDTSSSILSKQSISRTSSSAVTKYAVSVASSSAASKQVVSLASSSAPSKKALWVTPSLAPSKRAIAATSSSALSKHAGSAISSSAVPKQVASVISSSVLSEQAVLATSSSAPSKQSVSTTTSLILSKQSISATTSSVPSKQSTSTTTSLALPIQAVLISSSSAPSKQAVSVTSSSAQSKQAASVTSSSAPSKQAVSVTSSSAPSKQAVSVTSSSAQSKQAASSTSSSDSSLAPSKQAKSTTSSITASNQAVLSTLPPAQQKQTFSNILSSNQAKKTLATTFLAQENQTQSSSPLAQSTQAQHTMLAHPKPKQTSATSSNQKKQSRSTSSNQPKQTCSTSSDKQKQTTSDSTDQARKTRSASSDKQKLTGSTSSDQQKHSLKTSSAQPKRTRSVSPSSAQRKKPRLKSPPSAQSELFVSLSSSPVKVPVLSSVCSSDQPKPALTSTSAQSRPAQSCTSLSAYLKSILSAPSPQPESVSSTTYSTLPEQATLATSASVLLEQAPSAISASVVLEPAPPETTSSAQANPSLSASSSSIKATQTTLASSTAKAAQIVPPSSPADVLEHSVLAISSSASTKQTLYSTSFSRGTEETLSAPSSSDEAENYHPTTSSSDEAENHHPTTPSSDEAENHHPTTPSSDEAENRLLTNSSPPQPLSPCVSITTTTTNTTTILCKRPKKRTSTFLTSATISPKTSTHMTPVSKRPSLLLTSENLPNSPSVNAYDYKIECSKCSRKQSIINSLKSKIVSLNQQFKLKKRKLKEPMKLSIKSLKQQLKRRDASVAVWKNRCEKNQIDVDTMQMMSLQWVESEQKLKAAVEQCQKLFQKSRELQSQVSSCQKEREKEKKEYNKETDKLLTKIDLLKTKLKEGMSMWKRDLSKRSDAYSQTDDISQMAPLILRKCVYKCLMLKVAVTSCGDLIKYFCSTLVGRGLQIWPNKQTIYLMNLELSVFADVHVGHCLYHGSDAATITLHTACYENRCMNQVHITSPSGQKMKIDLTITPGGEPEDNYAHVSQAFLDIIAIFSHAADLPEMAVKDVLIQKIKKSDSEKAKVHNFVVRRLKEEFDLDLLEIKCSIHPLDGFAQAAKSTLARIDRKWELSTTGDYSLMCKLIYDVVKMRYSSSVGNPHGFHSFIKEKKLLNKGFNVRYMGNRPCVLFHMSAAVYNIRGPLVEYLSQVQKKKLAARIVEVLKNPYIEIQLQCMALFSMFLCVPWMREFHKSVKDTTQVVKDKMFKMCMVALARVVSEPNLLFTTQTDVFGDPLELEESILQDVQSKGELYLYHAKKYQDCIVELATAFSDTLQCLVTDTVQSLFHEAAEALLAATTPTVSDSVSYEQKGALGLYDALWRRAPHAHVFFWNGKYQSKANRTIEWLEGLEVKLCDNYFSFARNSGRVMRPYKKNNNSHEGKDYKKEKLSSLKNNRKERRKLQKLIAESLSKNEDVLALSCFDSLKIEVKSQLGWLLNENNYPLPNSILKHVCVEEGKLVTYLELIKCVDNIKSRKGTSRHVFLYYWTEEEDSANTFFSLEMSEFLTNFATGELVFMSCFK